MHIEGSILDITSSNFRNNFAQYQVGVLIITESNVSVQASYFTSNEAIAGCGVMAIETNSNVSIKFSQFTENSATCAGGVFDVQDSAFLLEENTFRNNTSLYRGGMTCIARCTFVVVNCLFEVNQAADNAGVFLVRDDSTVSIRNSTFVENTAGRNGGVVDVGDSNMTIGHL